MNILMHVCCGPCAVYPLTVLRRKGFQVKGYFYNPNIHPYKEFRKRIIALEELAAKENFSIEIDKNYGLKEYLRKVVFNENTRCTLCYEMRLEQAVNIAVEHGFDAITTTLLYSKYQKHDLIREKGEKLAKEAGIAFYYEDFRDGWQEGIDRSIEMNIYRQPYCGCIYSEQERYDKKFRKKK